MFYKKEGDSVLAGPKMLFLNCGFTALAQDYKKRNALRLKTFNAGTFLLEPVRASVQMMVERMKNAVPTILDTTHFKSDESSADYDKCRERQDEGHFSLNSEHTHLNVLVLGLKGCGKTTLIKRMMGEKFEARRNPTLKAEVTTVKWNSRVSYRITDVCGADPKSWSAHFMPVDEDKPAPYAIIFVIDSTNPQVMPECKDRLQELLRCPQLRDTVFVIHANKHGNTESKAEPIQYIMRALGLSGGVDHQLGVVTSSCRLGTGIVDPLHFIMMTTPDGPFGGYK